MSGARRHFALALALFCSACGGSPAASRTTLVVANWADVLEQVMEEAIVRRFQEARPNVRVVMESVTNPAEYRERMLTSIAAGAPSDVFLLDNIDVPAFAERGALVDLAPYAERVGLPLSAFDPTVLAIFRRGAAVYAFPKGFTPMMIAYNKDLFDRAGVPYPGESWTWEEFVLAARSLTRDRDGDGTVDQWGAWLDRRAFVWISFIWSLGGDVLCEDGTRATGCLDSPRSIEAFRMLTDLAVRDSVVPRLYGLRRSVGDHLRGFYSGRIAMIPSGHFWVPSFRPHVAAGRLRIGFAPIPRRPGFTSTTVIYASGFAVPKNARHKRLSVELAAMLADSAAQWTRAMGGLEIPALTAVAERLAREDTTGWEAAFARAVASGRLPWGARIARWREVEAVLPDIVDRVVLNREDVATVLREVARRVDRVLGVHAEGPVPRGAGERGWTEGGGPRRALRGRSLAASNR